MKTPCQQFILLAALVAASALVPESARAGSKTAAATNAPPAIPISEFDVNLPSGRDPFFPRSVRRTVEVTATKTTAVSDPTSLVLQGLSHATLRPIATINNQSFSAGEEAEVIAANGRMRIRCEEIKEESVIISIGGSQRLELKMQQKY